MAITRTEETPNRLSPTQSVQQFQGQVLSGATSGQPLPRTVMQSTVPKVPYSAKTGSGAMPSADPNNIFSTVRPKTADQVNALKPKPKPKTTSVGVPSSSGGSYSTAKGPVGARGAYGLEKGAGTRLQALQSAYRQHFGSDLPVISGGRTFQEQAALYSAYKSGHGNLAAKPGTSVHESGRAVDFGGAAHGYSPQQSWLAANAPKFGWHWAGKAFGEAWHFEAMY